MTTELEKQFFDTFGIEPRKVKICRNINHCPKKYKLCNDDCKHWQVIRTDYPQITDRILLELMFLITGISTSFELRNIRNVTALKTAILEFFIKKYGGSQNRKILKHQVQALFKEV